MINFIKNAGLAKRIVLFNKNTFSRLITALRYAFPFHFNKQAQRNTCENQ